MSVETTVLTFAGEGPISAAVDEKGRVAIPAGYAKKLRRFWEAEKAEARNETKTTQEESQDTGESTDAEEQPSVYFAINANDDRALRVYPPGAWAKQAAALRKRVDENPDDLDLEDYAQAFMGSAAQATVDRQNRVRVPHLFLAYTLNVEKGGKLTFMGNSDYILLFEEKDSMDFIRGAVGRYRRSRAERRPPRV